jgi:hypothetical protein
MAPAQHVVSQPLRPGLIRNAAIKHRFDSGIAAAYNVANHDAIGRRIELLRIESFMNTDAEIFQLPTHRRIDVVIASGYAMSGRACQCGDATHEGAADS